VFSYFETEFRFSVYRKFFNLFGAIQVQLVKLIYSFPTGLCSIDSSSTSTWLLPQLVSLFNALSLPSVHRLFFAQQGFYFHLVLVLSDVPHRRLVLAHHSSVSSTINVLTLPSVHRLYIASQAHFFI